MRRKTPGGKCRPRRWRSSRSRANQPRLQLFVLYSSVVAVLALALLAFGDAEPMSMRAQHHHAGQGHARPSDRRDAEAGRERLGPASSGASVDHTLQIVDQPRCRVDTGGNSGRRPAAGAAIGETRGRGVAAHAATTTAFVASSSHWPAASASAAGAGGFAVGQRDGGAASSSWVTRPSRREQPTREPRPWLQHRVPGPAGPRRDGGGSRSSWGGEGGRSRGNYNQRQQGSVHGSPSPPWYAAAAGNSALFMGNAGGGATAAAGGGGLTRPPLLITIGPQCAGKTSLLKGLAAKSEAARKQGRTSGDGGGGSPAPPVMDVTIDDHPSVYHKIPTGLLLDGCARGSPEDTPVGRRPLSDRLGDPGCVETRLVALRLMGRISAVEFADRVEGLGGQASPAALAALCRAVESAVSDQVEVSTPTVDVFVRENLFPDAISSSQERLATAARTSGGLVAWGNTNTQARDYQGALEQAELTGRPVRFLRWGHELPVLSLEELSWRNVCRFASTGRYVETAAVESALSRVDKLYASTSWGDPRSLALAAGFDMDADGRVHSRTGSGSQQSRGRGSRRPYGRGGAGDGGHRGSRSRWRASPELPEAHRGDTVALSGSRAGGGHSRGSGDGSIAASSYYSNTGFYGGGDGRARRDGTPHGAPLGLAQEWVPRGGSVAGGAGAAPPGASAGGAAGSSRRWDYSDAAGGGAAGVPPTVMFGNEWGRKREWRRTGYTDDDIDPTMSSCFFRTPANSTGVLRRSDLGEGVGADLEEMELVRRIRSIRRRR